MKPLTILAMIAGGIAGITTFQLFDAGLVAGPSTGSIFSYLALTPKGNFIGIISGVIVATIVSFVVASIILKFDRKADEGDLESSMEKSKSMKSEGKDILNGTENTSVSHTGEINKISFACDAGAGSSALGATTFRKKLKKENIDSIEVKHYRIEDVPEDSDIIIVHNNLVDRTRISYKDHRIIAIENYIGDPKLESLINELKER